MKFDGVAMVSGTLSSLLPLTDCQASAKLVRELEGIRHLLTSVAERAKELEEEIGDPVRLARSIIAEDLQARVCSDPFGGFTWKSHV